VSRDNSWVFFNPVRVLSGKGILEELGSVVFFKRPLLVTTPGSTRRGVTARVRKILGNHVLVYDRVTPTPDIDHLDTVAQQLRSKDIDGIVALGGGSALDSGKALSACLSSHEGRFLNAVFRSESARLPEHCPPLITIPTTSGTGSEVTPFATIWDRREHRKYSLDGKQLYARLALLDPELTLTLSRQQTLYSGLDCISHALETLWNRKRTPVSEAFALRALQLAVEVLPALLDDLNSLEHRTTMQNASLLSGLAISQNRTALAHSISYPLTIHFGVPHGLAASFTLVALIDYIREHAVPLAVHASRSIVDKARELLVALDLRSEIARFVGAQDIIAKLGEMFTPNRASNFIVDVDQDTVRALIERSMGEVAGNARY